MPETNNVIGMEELSIYDAFIKNYVKENGGSGGSSEYELPIASTSKLGGVKIDGNSITIDNNGVISAVSSQSSYELPTASTTTLGGVKVDGTSITIDNNGVISAISSSSSSSGYANPYEFSTEERIVGKWINNKPLYQKTLVFTDILSSSATAMTYNHNISNLDEIIEVKSFFHSTNGNNFSLPYIALSSAGNSVSLNYAYEINSINSTQIIIRKGRDTYSSATTGKYTGEIKVTILYTKTTN